MIYSLIYSLVAWCRSSLQVYGIIVSVLAIEYILYDTISSTSRVIALKQFNLCSMWDSSKMLVGYCNINLLGIPVPRITIDIVLIAMLFLAGTLGGIVLNSSFRMLDYSRIRRKWIWKMQHTRKTGIKRMLIEAEALKCWFCEKGFYLLIVSVFVIQLFSVSVKENLRDNNRMYYKQYVKKVEGTYTDKKMNYLLEEQSKLQEIQDTMEEPGITSSAHEVFERELLCQDGLEEAISYGEYLSSNGNLNFVYSSGYEQLLNGTLGYWNRMLRNLIAIFVMAGVSGYVLGIEENTGMKQIIAASTIGYRKLKRQKIKITFINGIIIFAVVYIPGIIAILHEYGYSQILAPIKSIQCYCMWPECFSILAVIIMYYLLHIFMLWVVSGVEYIVQKRMHSYIISIVTTVIASTLIVLLTGLL